MDASNCELLDGITAICGILARIEEKMDGRMTGTPQIAIERCGLSNRTVHALLNNGIEHVSDLSGESLSRIGKFRNIGVKCVEEIRVFAEKNGIEINE